MEGLTKTQIDKAESKDFALGGKPMRPRDAATLILIDRSAGAPRVLMGRRSQRHAFMPGRLVFPGGRTDPSDSRIAVAHDMHPDVGGKLQAETRGATMARARAIALSAVRETWEEAGLLIGHKGAFSTSRKDWLGFADHNIQPSLEHLRYIARAITPPGRVRRFDTRFFACFRDAVALELPEGGPTDELEELVWLTLPDAMEAEIPAITKTILQELERRLNIDPDLSPGADVPFYRLSHGKFLRTLL